MKKTLNSQKEYTTQTLNGTQKTSFQVKNKTRQIIYDELFENIDKLINEIKTIKKIIYLGNNQEEIVINLSNYFEHLLELCSEKTKSEFGDLIEKNKKYKNTKDFKHRYSMENEDCLFFYNDIPSQELKKIVLIHNGISRLKYKAREFSFLKKYREIFETNDIDELFIKKIKGTENEEILIKMFGDPIEIEKVKKGLKSKKLTRKNIQYRNIQQNISKNNITCGNYDNLSLSFFVEPKIYEEITQDNSSGSHFTNTVINLIKNNNGKNLDETIHHEQKHNLIETFLPSLSIADYSFFQSSLKKIEYLISYNIDPQIIKNEKKVLFSKISNFFDSSIVELLCDFEVLFNGENTTAFSNYNKLIIILANDKEKIEKSKFDNQYKNQLINIIPELLEKIILHYKKIYKELADFLFIAEKNGMKDELFALLLIYQPSNFFKIKKYFEKKIGKEKYNQFVFVRQIIKPQYFRIPKEDDKNPIDRLFYAIFQIKRTFSAHEIEEFSIFDSKKLHTINSYKNIESELNQEIKNTFLRKNFDGFIRENNLTNIIGLEELLFELSIFLQNNGLNLGEINQIENQIWDDFDLFVYEEIMDGKYSTLFDVLNNTSEENEFFIKNLYESINNEYGENLEEIKLKKAMSILKNHERSSHYFNQ